MKPANNTPVFQKDDRMNKANYRPISILPNLLERCLYNQLHPFFDVIVSIQQCGSRKAFNVQHCIIRLTVKLK